MKINIKVTETIKGIINIKNKNINFMSSVQKNAEIPEDIAPKAPINNEIPEALPSFFSSSGLTLFR